MIAWGALIHSHTPLILERKEMLGKGPSEEGEEKDNVQSFVKLEVRGWRYQVSNKFEVTPSLGISIFQSRRRRGGERDKVGREERGDGLWEMGEELGIWINNFGRNCFEIIVRNVL